MIISEIKRRVIALLQSAPEMYGINIFEEFIGGRKAPTNCPMLVVGISGIQLVPGALGDFIGMDGDKELSANFAEITLRLDCYSEQSGDKVNCHMIFEKLAGALLSCGLGVYSINSGEIRHSKGDFSSLLSASAKILTPLSTALTPVYVSDFILKTKGGFHEL